MIRLYVILYDAGCMQGVGILKHLTVQAHFGTGRITGCPKPSWLLCYSEKLNNWLSQFLCHILVCFEDDVENPTKKSTLKIMGRNTRQRLVFSTPLLSCSSRFLCALQQYKAQSRLLYLLNIPTLAIE